MQDYDEVYRKWRDQSTKKSISYILLVEIPAFVIGTVISITMIPITTVIIVLCYIFNAIKRCATPEDQIRMIKNMYWGG